MNVPQTTPVLLLQPSLEVTWPTAGAGDGGHVAYISGCVILQWRPLPGVREVDVGGKCNIIGVVAFAVRLADAHEQFGFPIGGEHGKSRRDEWRHFLPCTLLTSALVPSDIDCQFITSVTWTFHWLLTHFRLPVKSQVTWILWTSKNDMDRRFRLIRICHFIRSLLFYLVITSNKPPVCYLKMCPQSTTVMYYIW